MTGLLICPACATWKCGQCGAQRPNQLRFAPKRPCVWCGNKTGWYLTVKHEAGSVVLAEHTALYEQHMAREETTV